MMKRIAVPALMISVFCLGCAPSRNEKGPRAQHAEGRVADLAKEAKVTIDQAIKTALDKTPGTVVEAELERKRNKTVWEVEVLGADGKVTEIHIDAATGTIVTTETGQDDSNKDKQ